MAVAVHVEARGEPAAGKRAVMDVILNRARIRGLSVCAVVKQRGQFPWYDGKPLRLTTAALTTLHEAGRMPTSLPPDAEFFHHKRLRPVWTHNMRRVAVIGNHVFLAKE
jgi:spore germination cell wall hydrolase CwlJ-like protein